MGGMSQGFSVNGARALRYLVGFSLVLFGCSLLLMQAATLVE